MEMPEPALNDPLNWEVVKLPKFMSPSMPELEIKHLPIFSEESENWTPDVPGTGTWEGLQSLGLGQGGAKQMQKGHVDGQRK